MKEDMFKKLGVARKYAYDPVYAGGKKSAYRDSEYPRPKKVKSNTPPYCRKSLRCANPDY